MNEPAPDAQADRFAWEPSLSYVIRLVLIGTLVITGLDLAGRQWINGGAEALTDIILAIALLLSYRGHARLSAHLMAWSCTAGIAVIIGHSAVVDSPAMLTLPCILTFYAIIGEARLYRLMIACIVLFLTARILWGPFGGPALTDPVQGPIADLLESIIVLVVTALAVWNLAGRQRQTVAQLRQEISRGQDHQRVIDHMAKHDPLTDLPTRPLARSHFHHAADAVRQHGGMVAVLFCDLDNFKSINDTLGHAAGDAVIKTMAQRITATIRPGDMVARMGGDELVLTLVNITSRDEVRDHTARILDVVNRPLLLGDTEVLLSSSIGVAFYPDDGVAFDDLLKHADIAMYEAKQAGRNTFRIYDPHMSAAVLQLSALAADLRRGLAAHEFRLHFQPLFDLRSGRIVGAEALVRWQHPQRGLLSPEEFITVAETSGTIVDIGHWILYESCRQARIWTDQGLPPLVVSVNVSQVQVRRENFDQVVAGALAAAGLPAARLKIEMTESHLFDDSAAAQALIQSLRDLGILLCVDDFGTGYSNLHYIRRFPIAWLKIDRSFIHAIGDNSQDQAIVRAIIQMAHSLDIKTVAEGIEDQRTHDYLINLGCDLGQGFLYSPALPDQDFIAYVASLQAMSPSSAAAL